MIPILLRQQKKKAIFSLCLTPTPSQSSFVKTKRFVQAQIANVQALLNTVETETEIVD